MNKTARRVLEQIAKHSGVTSPGLVAADLRLSTDTVKRHVRVLTAGGWVQVGHDGRQLELTDAARRTRELDPKADTVLRRDSSGLWYEPDAA